MWLGAAMPCRTTAIASWRRLRVGPKARLESQSRFGSLFEHDRFRKSVPTFRDHALGKRQAGRGHMRELLALACLVASLAVSTVMAQVPAAHAQSYPSRPIKLVLTTPAGGPNEFIVRILAERLGAALGQPVVVDNRPGGAGG